MLGFPCNQFGAQEPGTHEEILAFVKDKYDVTFPMFEKLEVNGDGADPLYQLLTDGEPIQWNFTKFLVGREGEILARYEPATTPEQIGAELSQHLG